MKGKTTKEQACEECKKLFGAGRSTKSHANLELIELNEVSSIQGNADEHYYRCRKCGYELMHETGNCGMGWVTFS